MSKMDVVEVPKDGEVYKAKLSSVKVKWVTYRPVMVAKLKKEGRYQYKDSFGKWKNLPDPEVFKVVGYK